MCPDSAPSLSLSKCVGFTSFLDLKNYKHRSSKGRKNLFFPISNQHNLSPGFESVEKIPPAAFAVSPPDCATVPISLSLSLWGSNSSWLSLSTVVLEEEEEEEEEEGVGHSGMSPGGQPTTSCSRHRFTEGRGGLIGGWRVF